MANILNKDVTFCVISTTSRIIETCIPQKIECLVTVEGMDLEVKYLGES